MDYLTIQLPDNVINYIEDVAHRKDLSVDQMIKHMVLTFQTIDVGYYTLEPREVRLKASPEND